LTEFIPRINWKDEVIAIHPKEKLKEGMFPHRVSLIIPKGIGDTFIFSKRAKDKHPFPNTWCPGIGGKVQAHESYEQAALREMKEEAGLSSNLIFVAKLCYDEADYQAIFHVFSTTEELNIDIFKPDPSEIQHFKAFRLDEIEVMILQNPNDFAPTFREALKVFAKEWKTLTIA